MSPSVPVAAAPPECVIVAGMHRSGTSLTAGLLAAIGVGMGDRLMPADRANPHGYVEDLDVVRFHQRVFRTRFKGAAIGHPDWGWTPTETVRADDLATWRPEARRLVDRRAAADLPWGFKDPRTTVVLDFWDPLLPTPAYVGVYRDPSRVADSMQRLGAAVFLRNPDYAWAIWNFYNRRLIDFVRRHRARCILVNVDALVGELTTLPDLLAERLGLDVQATDLDKHYVPELLHSPQRAACPPAIWRRVWEDTAALYEELESIADLPADRTGVGGGPPPFTSPNRSRDAELSIIIPTHNDAVSLVEALASAEACASGRHEILVLDDGTTDPDSLRILDKLREAGQPVLRQANAGLAAARNALVAATNGRYVLPLDADNRLHPGFIERALEAFRDDPRLGVVYGDHRLFGARTGRMHVPDHDLRRSVNRNEIDACAIFRRDAWNDVGGYDAMLPGGFEDWEFWLHVGKRGWRFLHLQQVAFDYRVRPGSLLARNQTPANYKFFRRRLWRRHADLLLASTPAALRAILRVTPPFPADIQVLSAWQRLTLRAYWHLVWMRPAAPLAEVEETFE
jgi:glycosyltransferase involved in cell wall biosynthesis